MHLNIHFSPIPFLNGTNLTQTCAMRNHTQHSENHYWRLVNQAQIHDPLGLKLLTRLRLCLSHLNEHRFNHNFDSCINPLCSCSLEVESIKHFFLHCHHYTNIHKTFLNTVEMINESILNVNDDDLIKILLFGNCKFSLERNLSIIKASINYIKNSKRFDKSLFWGKTYFLFFFHTIGFCVVQVLRFPYYFHNVLFPSSFNSFNCEQSGNLNWIYTSSMLSGFLYLCLAFVKCD